MSRPPAAEQLVDVVDADDCVVAVVPRSQMRAQRLRHRAVFVAVLSSAGEVLVHRRSEHKDLWPGWWDLAVGGVVDAGESYDVAAAREVAEELGVDVAVARGSLQPLGGGRYEDAEVALVGRVYRLVHDGPFTFADGEVVEATFVPVPELLRRCAVQRFLPDSRALVLPHLVG